MTEASVHSIRGEERGSAAKAMGKPSEFSSDPHGSICRLGSLTIWKPPANPSRDNGQLCEGSASWYW